MHPHQNQFWATPKQYILTKIKSEQPLHGILVGTSNFFLFVASGGWEDLENEDSKQVLVFFFTSLWEYLNLYIHVMIWWPYKNDIDKIDRINTVFIKFIASSKNECFNLVCIRQSSCKYKILIGIFTKKEIQLLDCK